MMTHYKPRAAVDNGALSDRIRKQSQQVSQQAVALASAVRQPEAVVRKRKRKRNLKAELTAWEQRKHDSGEPVWAHPSFPQRAWIGQIAAETGLSETTLSDKRSPCPRLIDAAARKLGLRVKLPEAAPIIDGFDEFIALATAVRNRQMEEAGKSAEQRRTAEQVFRSYLKRAAQSVETVDGSRPDEVIQAAITLAEGRENRDRKYIAELRKGLEFCDVIGRQHDLPPEFAAALSRLVEKSGRSARQIAIAAGITQQVIQRWMSGLRAPGPEAEHKVQALERELAVPEGILLSRIRRRERKRPADQAARAKATGPLAPDEQARLEQRRSARTFKPEWWKARKAGRATRPDDSRWPTQIGAETFEYLAYRTAELVDDLDDPMRRETGAIGDAAAQMYEQSLGHIFAFCCDPRNPDFNIAEAQLSMAYLVFPKIVSSYRRFLAMQRAPAGKPVIVGRDVAAIVQWRMMTEPNIGFLAQNPTWSDRLRPVQRRDGTFLISPDEVAAAQADWGKACAKAHGRYNSMARDSRKQVKPSLNPHQRIRAILELDEPRQAFRLGMLGLQGESETIEPGSKANAAIIRDQVIWGLQSQMVLRTTTLGQIAVGMLTRQGGHWYIYLPHGAFKNDNGPYFRDAQGRRLDFQRRLVDRDGLYAAIEAYLGDARARLLRKRRHDKLFVSEKKGGALGEGGVTQALSRTYERYVRYDPDRETGIPGVQHTAATHWFRHVMATGVLKATLNLGLAAQAIHDSPLMVLKHYGYLVAKGGGDIAEVAADY